MSRFAPTSQVWAMTVVLAIVGALAPLISIPGTTPVGTAGVFLFACAFFAGEAAIFHLEIRGQAHSFSLGTMTLAVGLVLLGPLPLLLSRVLGAGVALFLVRKLPALKSMFNLALFAAEITVAAVVVRSMFVVFPDMPLAVAAIAGVIAADITGLVAVHTVISIFEGRPRPAQVAAVAQSQLFLTLISGSLGVVGAVAFSVQAVNGLFVIAGAAGIVAVLRSHARLAQQHTSLSALYEFTRGVDHSLSLERLAVTAIEQAADVLAATVYIAVLDEGPLGQPTIVSLEDASLQQLLLPATREDWLAAAEHGGGTQVATLSGEVGTFFRDRGQREVLFSRIDAGLEHPVLFVATKPHESVGSFGDEHKSLLDAFGSHLAAIFRNGVLLERLRAAALKDDLTELPNLYALEGALRESGEQEVDRALVRIAIDGLSDIVDTLGHRIGDQVVCEVGRRLESATGERESFTFTARIGGGEFGVVIAGTTDAAVVSAEELCAAASGPVRMGDLELDVVTHAGVADASAAGAESDPVREADVALQAAKEGRDQVVVYEPALEGDRRRRLEIVGRLRSAIDRNELQLWYQPKVDMASGEIIGAEALARWIDDELGFVPPDEFIKVAEATGLIDPLTDRLIDVLLDQLLEWRRRGIDITVALNLSSMNLLDEALPERIMAGLESRSLPVTALALEVTETAVMSDTELVIRVLDDLAARGLEIAVDDYGTGYSSLAYLRRLPVTQLKIDRSFIKDLPDEQDEVIVRSTIELGHALGMRVVAEGVEEAAGYECLRELGCDYVQGYFIAKPLPHEGFEDFWRDRHALRAMLSAVNPPEPRDEPSTTRHRAAEVAAD